MENKNRLGFPEKGTEKQALLEQMRNMKKADVKWKEGRTFSYVYFAGDEILNTVKEAYNLYFSENALNPSAFKSLRNMEAEVIEMCADLFSGDAETTGSITSGGTESILMAVKTAREWAKKHKPNASSPEVVIPASAHPAFHKAFHYFGLTARVVSVDPDFKADPGEMEAAIGDQTIMLVASAPSYPQGVVDPVSEIAAIAQKHDLLCHVDSCIGGFMLPFIKKLGFGVPDFDFSVAGVTSLSADIHKYGYAAKGASVILYKNAELRKAQFYVYTQWAGGIYGSPTMTGTRPGGAIAAAWAAIRFIGMEGYLELAKKTMEATLKIQKAITEIPEIKMLGQPTMSIFSIASDQVDIYEVGDELTLMGWSIDRQQLPPTLHLTITPNHLKTYDAFVNDLQMATKKANRLSIHKLSNKLQLGTIKGLKKILPEKTFDKLQSFAAEKSEVGGERSAAMYGMMGELQGSGNLDDLVKVFLDKLMSKD